MCDAKIVWGIQRQDKKVIPVCNSHVGTIMESLYKKDGATFGFMYLGDQEIPAGVKCQGNTVGRSVKVDAVASVSVEPPSPEGKPSIAVAHSVEVR